MLVLAHAYTLVVTLRRGPQCIWIFVAQRPYTHVSLREDIEAWLVLVKTPDRQRLMHSKESRAKVRLSN